MRDETRKLLQKAAISEDPDDLSVLSRALIREQYYQGGLPWWTADTLNKIARTLAERRWGEAGMQLMELHHQLISPFETEAQLQLPDSDQLGRRFRELIFLGNGNNSQIQVMVLHEMLDQAISTLSGMQQGGQDPLGVATAINIAQDIYTALTGHDFGMSPPLAGI